MHAKKACADRFYQQYQEDGRGFMSLVKEYKAIMVQLHKIPDRKERYPDNSSFKDQQNKALHSVPMEAEK